MQAELADQYAADALTSVLQSDVDGLDTLNVLARQPVKPSHQARGADAKASQSERAAERKRTRPNSAQPKR